MPKMSSLSVTHVHIDSSLEKKECVASIIVSLYHCHWVVGCLAAGTTTGRPEKMIQYRWNSFDSYNFSIKTTFLHKNPI